LAYKINVNIKVAAKISQLFFRIQLLKYLEKFYGEKLSFYTADGQMQGIFKEIDNGTIQIEDLSGNPSSIPADSICYIIKN